MKSARLLILILLFCSACSTVQQAQRTGAPVVERTKIAETRDIARPPPETGGGPTRTEAEPIETATGKEKGSAVEGSTERTVKDEPGISENPAVVALLDETRFKARQGKAEEAIHSIERALRLEPKNPWLWHRLAVLRFKNHQWRQAVALAEKSNSLSGRYPELRKANTELINRAKRHQQ